MFFPSLFSGFMRKRNDSWETCNSHAPSILSLCLKVDTPPLSINLSHLHYLVDRESAASRLPSVRPPVCDIAHNVILHMHQMVWNDQYGQETDAVPWAKSFSVHRVTITGLPQKGVIKADVFFVPPFLGGASVLRCNVCAPSKTLQTWVIVRCRISVTYCTCFCSPNHHHKGLDLTFYTGF